MARRWIRADDRPRRRPGHITTGERREVRAGRLAEELLRARARGRLVPVVATITGVLTGAVLAGGDGLPLARADPGAGPLLGLIASAIAGIYVNRGGP